MKLITFHAGCPIWHELMYLGSNIIISEISNKIITKIKIGPSVDKRRILIRI